MADTLLARLIRQNGHRLVEKAVDALVKKQSAATKPSAPAKPRATAENPSAPPKRPSLPRRIAGAALMRVASRSVPGAIVVGGVLLAKHLHDRKQAKSDPQASAPDAATMKDAKPKA
jgi:pyruvate/2-oxoglutarate dehydrogenase complex dihydrolipoamide acyltransferase (E2) component